MATVEASLSPALVGLLDATSALPPAETLDAISDSALSAEQRGVAEARRRVDAYAAAVAGQIAYRSRPELGQSGLAQRAGFRGAREFVQHETGSTAREAAVLVDVGQLVTQATGLGGEITCPWLLEVGAAVAAGTLSIEAARSIHRGLGEPTADDAGTVVSVDALARAAALLVAAASAGLNPDELYRRARDIRDDLSLQGVVDREMAIHDQRSIRRVRRANGLNRYIVDPDIEAAALWDDVYDKLTSPRRGGPRFVDAASANWADAIRDDDRSPEQYLHDAMTELLRQAVTAGTPDSRRVVGSRMPSVRVLVAANGLESGAGVGHIDGQELPVSLATVERLACANGIITIGLDPNGQVIDLGREQRLYSTSQRVALSARDGGCRADGCRAPASWCEAHHIVHWKRDRGKTDIADGVLLCRFHHQWVHNNGWEITRDRGDYWLVPPPNVDPARVPRAMPSKSAALSDLLARA